MQIDKCFGFESAVEEAQRALLAGYVEAASARSGIGLIKLMGRQSGYIAMQASMASGMCLMVHEVRACESEHVHLILAKMHTSCSQAVSLVREKVP